MSFNSSVSRHILKAVSWRIVGTIDTLCIAFILTNNLNYSLSLSGFTIFTKILWYYMHERVWFKLSIRNSNTRHILKTFTWRVIGTFDTILISSILIKDGTLGLQMGGYETITKMILYFFHEKIWYRIDFGLDNRKKINVRRMKDE